MLVLGSEDEVAATSNLADFEADEGVAIVMATLGLHLPALTQGKLTKKPQQSSIFLFIHRLNFDGFVKFFSRSREHRDYPPPRRDSYDRPPQRYEPDRCSRC